MLTASGVEAYVAANEARIVGFLGEYIRQRSVNPGRAVGPDQSGGEGPAQAWLGAQVAGAGLGPVESWEEVRGRPNIAWSVGPRDAEVGLVFNGHADTVGVSAEQRQMWPGGDPWSGEVKDGKLYGRGAADMKAGTAAFFWAGKLLVDLGFLLRRRVLMTVSSGEEVTESDLGILSFVRRGLEGPLWIMAEPTDLRVCPVGLGIVYFRVTVHGEASHVANRAVSREQLAQFEAARTGTINVGVDASYYAFRIYSAIMDLEEEEGKRAAHPLCGAEGGRGICAVRIAGGAQHAEMMGTCVMEFAASLDPNDTVSGFMDRVQRCVGRVTSESRWLQSRPPSVEWPIVHAAIEPLHGPDDDALLNAIRGVGSASHRKELPLSCMRGPCDANVLVEHGRRAIVCGPARLQDGGHGTGEFVRVQSLLEGVKQFALMTAAVCGE